MADKTSGDVTTPAAQLSEASLVVAMRPTTCNWCQWFTLATPQRAITPTDYVRHLDDGRWCWCHLDATPIHFDGTCGAYEAITSAVRSEAVTFHERAALMAIKAATYQRGLHGA